MRISLKEIILVFSLCALGLVIFGPYAAFAKEFIPLQGEGFGVFPEPEGGTGVEMAKSLAGKIVDNVRYIIGAIAVLMIMVASFQLIAAQGNEETYNKAVKIILYAVAGLVVIGLAGDLAEIFSVERGGFVRDPSKMLKQVRLFNRTVEIVLTFIKYMVGAVATVALIRSGLRMVILGSNDEELAKDKKNLAWSIAGLVFILVASPLVNEVFYKIDTSRYTGMDTLRPVFDANRGLREIVGVTNVLVSFAGPAAILALIAGGILYTISGEDEEMRGKAKKIITWALIGLVVIFGAFGIVSTFVARKFEAL